MKFYLLLITVAFAFAGPQNPEVKQILHAGNNQFTGRMLSKAVEQNPDSSIVFSGFSVLTPLGQLILASRGKTFDELLNVTGFPNPDAIIVAFLHMHRDISPIPGMELKMADRIYIPLNYELDDTFALLSMKVFGSQVKNVDFTNKIQTAAEINDWVDIKTKHHIKNLINPANLGENVRALLVNVLYFKGTWKIKFDKKRTTMQKFYVHGEDFIQVPMMHNNAQFKYGQSNILEAQILEMPYVDGQSSMVVILPNQVDGIRSLVDKLEDLSILDQEIMNIYEQEVDVFLPKFKIETKIDLKKLLQKMNVTEVFSTEANLKNMLKTSEELFVSEAIQKSFIEVNEEGAEASAANEVLVVLKSPGLPPPQFYANHPFIFVLRTYINEYIGAINIFSGVYNG